MLEKNNVKCNYEFVPDIVLSLNRKIEAKKNGKVLLCFRLDAEKVSDHNDVINILKDLDYDYDMTDMVSFEKKCYENREQIVNDKLKQFSEYSLLITDRLHGMIFSTLAGTPCIAFDNISKKVSGVYEWIKDLEYIKCIDKSKLNAALIEKMMASKVFKCDFNILEIYYSKIIEVIK
jgi:pyruvyl transferase EpsI